MEMQRRARRRRRRQALIGTHGAEAVDAASARKPHEKGLGLVLHVVSRQERADRRAIGKRLLAEGFVHKVVAGGASCSLNAVRWFLARPSEQPAAQACGFGLSYNPRRVLGRAGPQAMVDRQHDEARTIDVLSGRQPRHEFERPRSQVH